jgi:hypothetical protein
MIDISFTKRPEDDDLSQETPAGSLGDDLSEEKPASFRGDSRPPTPLALANSSLVGRLAFLIGASTIILMGLFPPWVATGAPWPYSIRTQVEDEIVADIRGKKFADVDQKYRLAAKAGIFPPIKGNEERAEDMPDLQRMVDEAKLPPTAEPNRRTKKTVKNAGYHFVFESPGRDIDNTCRLFEIPLNGKRYLIEKGLDESVASYGVNLPRLLTQWAIVAILTAGFLWITGATTGRPSAPGHAADSAKI